MKPTITILEGVNIYKAEGNGRRLEYRVNVGIAHSLIGGDESIDKVCKIRGPGSNEFGQRIAVMIPLPQKNAVGSQSRLDESRVLDEDAVKTANLI